LSPTEEVSRLRREQQPVADFADFCEFIHVPDMIALAMNLAFRCEQVKRCELQVANGPHRPAVATVGIHVEIHSIEPLFVSLDKR